MLADYVLEHLPGLKLYHMDATYFAWIDFSGLGKEEGLEDFLVKECGVAFTPGREFGSGCGTFMRVNLACRWSLMMEAFRRIEAALKK